MVSVRRRSISGDGWADQGRLVRTAAFLRGDDALVPRGVYRFFAFDEAGALDDVHDDRYARAPEPDDVVRLCRALNEKGPAIS